MNHDVGAQPTCSAVGAARRRKPEPAETLFICQVVHLFVVYLLFFALATSWLLLFSRARRLTPSCETSGRPTETGSQAQRVWHGSQTRGGRQANCRGAGSPIDACERSPVSVCHWADVEKQNDDDTQVRASHDRLANECSANIR